MQKPTLTILTTPPFPDYELLDTGAGKKLERFGRHIFIRPEPQALWRPSLTKAWNEADGTFESKDDEEKGGWRFQKPVARFEMSYKTLRFFAEPTSFRHMGVFVEHASHWDFIAEKIANAKRPIKALNLFGYSGVATLAAVAAGATVTHVDASKKMLDWTKENLTLSSLEGKPVRLIPEDALTFVKREARRGETYDVVLIDPPKFGRGPQGEVWKFEEHFPELLQEIKKILSPEPLCVIITAYAITTSALSIEYALRDILPPTGSFETGEMATCESSSGKLLSHAVFSRWSA